MTTPNNRLIVYKASAGSGKTYTLALEYIKLLIADPTNYRYILAVTFTNKATEEMKTRILAKLFALSQGLPDGDDYAAEMAKAMPQLSPREVARRATLALDGILHNYHLFRVETIDSFFQSILRNLARELGLKASLNVGLNDKEVEEQAVDDMIEAIRSDNDPLLRWMMTFIGERIGDDKSWNVISLVKSFGTTIFRDFFKDNQDKLVPLLENEKFFNTYTARLRALASKADSDMKGFALQYDTLANQHGLKPTDFSRGTVPAYFDKLRSGNYCNIAHATIDKGIDDPDKLIRQKDRGTALARIVADHIAPLLAMAEKARHTAEHTQCSVTLTLRNINELRLLGRIARQVDSINADNNNFPLSSTQQLLGDLIDGSDTPFIYERIGGSLRFIMIDEFQDTSTKQWNNFRILLKDCIDHQSGSLIVGDVKQSIYRWRGGDWQLLQDLTPEKHPEVGVVHLHTNFRSQKNVVDFNNVFFSLAAAITARETEEDMRAQGADECLAQTARTINDVYADVEQLTRPNSHAQGLVSVALLPTDNYVGATMERLRRTVGRLLEKGMPQKSIAILVRSNDQIKAIAEFFQQNAVDVNGKPVMLNLVSDEAFRLDASVAVCTIVQAMRYLANPNDRLTAAFLAKMYAANNNVNGHPADSDLFIGRDNLNDLLPDELVTHPDELRAMPLASLAEHLYAMFHLDKLQEQSAYVCAFFDKLSALVKNKTVDMAGLLEAWDNDLAGKSIHSDEADGLRLLTIHKSKGMEFDNVIVPFCDWDVEKSSDTIWAAPRQAPYNELPLVPVPLQRTQLLNSIYANDYAAEHLRSLVDNLNLLYVAFTRASRNLFVVGRSGSSAKYPSHIIQAVISALPDLQGPEPPQRPATRLCPDLLHMPQPTDNGTVELVYGTLCPTNDKTDGDVANVFRQEEQGLHVDIEPSGADPDFKQSHECDEFITPQDSDDAQARQQYIDTGNVLHALFAAIRTTDDIDRAIDNLEFSGVLYNKPMTRQTLRQMVHRLLDDPLPRSWFDPHWQVLNERSIIVPGEDPGTVTTLRPDRVVTDGQQLIVVEFKTGSPRPEHRRQVAAYMATLRHMGYKQVKGYLWYLHTAHTEEVKA